MTPTEQPSTRELISRLEEIERQMTERRENAHAMNNTMSKTIVGAHLDIAAHGNALAELTPAIAAMGTQVAEIKTALVGDTFGNRGLVGRFDDGERDRAELRRVVDGHDRKLWAAGLTLSTAWGIIVIFKEKIFR